MARGSSGQKAATLELPCLQCCRHCGPIAEGIETIHIVGGASAFSEAIEHGIADVLYVTRVLTEHDTDVRMSWPLAADAAYKQVATGVS